MVSTCEYFMCSFFLIIPFSFNFSGGERHTWWWTQKAQKKPNTKPQVILSDQWCPAAAALVTRMSGYPDSCILPLRPRTKEDSGTKSAEASEHQLSSDPVLPACVHKPVKPPFLASCSLSWAVIRYQNLDHRIAVSAVKSNKRKTTIDCMFQW